MALKTRLDIFFSVHQCAQFTHNTKASHETAENRIYWYLQGTNYRGLVFNSLKKLVVDSYADADFVGLWGHQNTQDPIYTKGMTVFVVIFAKFPPLYM